MSEGGKQRKSIGRRASDFLVKVAERLSVAENTARKKKPGLVFDSYEYLGTSFPGLLEPNEPKESEGGEVVRRSSGVSVTFPSELRSAAFNAHHALLLAGDGTVFGCGANEFGELGTGADGAGEEMVKSPRLVVLPSLAKNAVVQVACGLHHSVCLLENGNVVSFGQNEYGQLGVSRKKAERGPQLVHHISREFVIQVECTYYSTLFLCRTGKVFAAGRGHYGVTGTDDLSDKFLPVLVEGALAGNPVKRIAAGSRHCLVVTVSGRVYGFGDNHKGQLGLDPSDTSEGISPVAIRVRLELPVRAVGCGEWHSLFLTESGVLYGCGSNSHGQLALREAQQVVGEGQECIVPPEEISALSQEDVQVINVACGRKHSCVLTRDGVVFGFGSAKDGQFGTGHTAEDVENPVRLAKSVSHVMAGGQSTFVLRIGTMDAGEVASQLTFKELYRVSTQQVKRYYTAVQQKRKAADYERKLANIFRNMFLTAYTLNASFLCATDRKVLSKTPTSGVNLPEYLVTLQRITECVKGDYGFRRLIAPLMAKLYQVCIVSSAWAYLL